MLSRKGWRGVRGCSRYGLLEVQERVVNQTAFIRIHSQRSCGLKSNIQFSYRGRGCPLSYYFILDILVELEQLVPHRRDVCLLE